MVDFPAAWSSGVYLITEDGVASLLENETYARLEMPPVKLHRTHAPVDGRMATLAPTSRVCLQTSQHKMFPAQVA
jgi:hypothetical protein